MRLVDGVAGGLQQAPADVPIAWEGNHFVKGQDGITYLPFTLNIDRSKWASPRWRSTCASSARPRRRLQPLLPRPRATPDQPPPRPIYPWDNLTFIEIPSNGELSRAIALKPGEDEAFITIKEKGTEKQEKNSPAGEIGLLRKELSIPDFDVPELTTSSVLVANAIEVLNAPLPAAQQGDEPLRLGPMKIGLSGRQVLEERRAEPGVLDLRRRRCRGRKTRRADRLRLPQKLAEGEKYFNGPSPRR